MICSYSVVKEGIVIYGDWRRQVSHGKDFGLYFKSNQKSLKDFKQESDMIWFLFLKDSFGALCWSELEGVHMRIVKTGGFGMVQVREDDDLDSNGDKI